MTRRRPKSEAVAVSLFPFLAVLLCTMGALIVLLVMLSLQAKDTVQAAPPPPAPEVDESEIARYEALQADLELLEADRDALLAQLEARSKVLEDLDIEGTRLEEELESLEALRGQLRNNSTSDVSDEELQANLTWYENKLFEKAEQLKEIKRRLAENPVSYAIVPYLGDSGTFRRPLYIECSEEGVILQPEGVILRADDFSVLAANNPLVSAIRETTNYWRSQGRAARGEAYPLLLVRPNGSLAFHAAKTALEFWSGDFGYELVDEDWNLEFSDPDPELARRQARAIDNARNVLVNLRRGGSGLLSQSTRPSFRVATQGSLEQVSPGSGGEGNGSGGGFGTSSGSNANGVGTSSGSPYQPGAGTQGSGDPSQLAGGGSRNGTEMFGSDGSGSGDSMLGAANGNSQGDPLSPMFGGANNPNGTGNGGTGGFGHQPNRVTGGQVTGQGGDGATNYVGMANPANDGAWRQNGAMQNGAGQPGSASGAMQPGSASGAMQSGALNNQVTSAGTPQMPGAVGQSGTSFSQSGTGMQSGNSGAAGASGAAGGASSAMQNGNMSFSNSSPGATGSGGGGGGAHREDNWALPNAGVGDVAVSRMMRVTLDANTLIIYPKDRQWNPEVVRLQTQTEQSLDDFRSAVWREMDRWGTAGQGMYWKPILKFQVTPDGADRYFELKRLMENSGFVLESQRVLPAQRAPQQNSRSQTTVQPQQPANQGPLIIRPAENFTGNRGTRR